MRFGFECVVVEKVLVRQNTADGAERRLRGKNACLMAQLVKY